MENTLKIISEPVDKMDIETESEARVYVNTKHTEVDNSIMTMEGKVHVLRTYTLKYSGEGYNACNLLSTKIFACVHASMCRGRGEAGQRNLRERRVKQMLATGASEHVCKM